MAYYDVMLAQAYGPDRVAEVNDSIPYSMHVDTQWVRVAKALMQRTAFHQSRIVFNNDTN